LEVVERPVELIDDVEYQLVTAKRSRGGVVARSRLLGRDILTKTQFKIARDDFLMSNRQIIHGGCGIVPPALDGAVVSNEYSVLKPKSKLSLEFLGYLSHSIYFQQTCFHASVGVDVEKMIFDCERWLEFRIHLPPLHEQNRIAETLSSVDEAIAATRAVIEKTTKVKQGVLKRLLTKGIGHTRLKQTEIGEIPERWKVGRLDDFFVLQRGFDLPVQSRDHGDVPVIASNGEIAKHSEWKIDAPAVITGRSGTLGKVFFYQAACWPLNTTLYVKDFKSNEAEFVSYFLQYFDVARFGTGTGVPTLNRNDVHRELVAFPPIDEQRVIVSVLRAIDENLDAEHALLHQLTATRSVLMSDLLAGRKRITDALPMAAE
jgi:type I restriction enzyme S subunit